MEQKKRETVESVLHWANIKCTELKRARPLTGFCLSPDGRAAAAFLLPDVLEAIPELLWSRGDLPDKYTILVLDTLNEQTLFSVSRSQGIRLQFP